MRALTFLVILFGSCILGYSGQSSQETNNPHAAADALKQACNLAQKKSKPLFLCYGDAANLGCVWFDRFHAYPEVKEIVEKYYVLVRIDAKKMPDGKVVFEAFTTPGEPAWSIITFDRKRIIDSWMPLINAGFPTSPQEVQYYLKALKTSTPKITDEELDRLKTYLVKSLSDNKNYH